MYILPVTSACTQVFCYYQFCALQEVRVANAFTLIDVKHIETYQVKNFCLRRQGSCPSHCRISTSLDLGRQCDLEGLVVANHGTSRTVNSYATQGEDSLPTMILQPSLHIYLSYPCLRKAIHMALRMRREICRSQNPGDKATRRQADRATGPMTPLV